MIFSAIFTAMGGQNANFGEKLVIKVKIPYTLDTEPLEEHR